MISYSLILLSVIAFSVFINAQDTDRMGISGGTSVCLEYTDIESELGHLDISYNSLNDIYGFQLNMTAITILAVESNVGAAYFTESTGFILGISLDGQPLPAGDGILARRVNRDSDVFVYFAGHGFQDEDRNAYLMPYDANKDYVVQHN